MLFQQINRYDADKVFANCFAPCDLVKDQTAQLDASSTADGNRVTSAATNLLDLVIGIVDAAVKAGNNVLVQIYGYRATSAVYTATGVTGASGDKLVPVAGQTYLQYVAAGDGRDGHFAAIGTIASATATKITSIALFIRAM